MYGVRIIVGNFVLLISEDITAVMVFTDKIAFVVTASDMSHNTILGGGDSVLYLVTFLVSKHIGPGFCRKIVLLRCSIEKSPLNAVNHSQTWYSRENCTARVITKVRS